ncbi:hypothetical protein [Arthrobacter sp. 3Tela_A]|uniref:hypothetical protein n=1 Tax=Arthrobacter sp. 3Tela_A TaxID=3093743 RepID=UPI003BB709AD
MKRFNPSWAAWPLMIFIGMFIAFWPEGVCKVATAGRCGLTDLQNAGYNTSLFGFAIAAASILMLVFDSRFSLITPREWIESSIASVLAAVLSLLFMPAETPLDWLLTAMVILLSATACLAASKGITAWVMKHKNGASKPESAPPHPLDCVGPDTRPLKAGEHVVAAALVGAVLLQGKRR